MTHDIEVMISYWDNFNVELYLAVIKAKQMK